MKYGYNHLEWPCLWQCLEWSLMVFFHLPIQTSLITCFSGASMPNDFNLHG